MIFLHRPVIRFLCSLHSIGLNFTSTWTAALYFYMMAYGMRMNGVLTSVVTHLFVVPLQMSAYQPSFYGQSAGQHIKIQCCLLGRGEFPASFQCLTRIIILDVFTDCPPGYGQNEDCTGCELCPENSWKSEYSNRRCIQCNTGQTTLGQIGVNDSSLCGIQSSLIALGGKREGSGRVVLHFLKPLASVVHQDIYRFLST